jgi:hypothetical protein
MRGATRRKPLPHAPNPDDSVAPSLEPIVLSERVQSNVFDICDDNDEGNDEGDDEAEFELLFMNGLEEVAKDSMLTQDFAKAETLLEKAIQRQAGSSSEGTDFKKLQIQLATCYFFQHKWRLAEPLISRIAKSKPNLDRVVCNLLHALALAHLADYNFDRSIAICKQALWGKKRLKRAFGAAHATEYNETLGLLATIYETKGDPMYAEVLRRTIPTRFAYEHPLNELEFIVKHPRLSQDVFGEKITLDRRQSHTIERRRTLIPELPTTDKPSRIEEKVETFYKCCREAKRPLRTLRAKLDSYERFEKDTQKEIVSLSIPSAASNSSEEFTLTNSHNSTPTSSLPEIATKRSFTMKIARFIDTVRGHPQVSSDDLTVPQTSETANVPSPLRRKPGKGLWSKNDTNIFAISIPRTRLFRRPRYEVQSEADTMDSWQRVHNWLRRSTSEKAPITSAYSYTSVGSGKILWPHVPEMAGGQIYEMMGL